MAKGYTAGIGSGGSGGGGTTDNTTEGHIPVKQSDAFENSALTEDATNITSTKPIVAPSVQVDVGTLHLGNAISMSVGGEQVYLKDGVDGSIHGVVYQDVGDTLPKARVLGAFNENVIRQPDKTGVVNDPRFEITPTENEQILSFTIEAWYPQTDVVLIAYKSGVEFYRHEIGSITGNVEFEIDLLTGNGVPVDVFASTTYEVELISSNGTVSLKGDATLQIPFYKVTYYDFDLQDLVTADLPINEETLISGFSTAASQQPTTTDSPIRIEFGAAQGTPSDPLEIDATGLITCNQSGTYFMQVYVQYGRTTSVGACDLYFAAFLNGVQVGNSSHARIDDGDTLIPTRSRSNIQLTAGDELEFLLVRDSSGIDNGGLFDGSPTVVGWEDSTCASIVMSRLVGNAATLQSDGDVVGPGSSNQDELATFANLSGKEIKASSNVKVINGIITPITGNLGLSKPTNNDITISSDDDSRAGFDIEIDSIIKGGFGYRVDQIVLQPFSYATNDNTRGIVVDVNDTQTRVESIKHYKDNGFKDGSDAIEASPSRHLYLKPTGGKRVYFGQNFYVDDENELHVTSEGIAATEASLEFNGPAAFKFPILAQAQEDATIAGNSFDRAKVIYNITREAFRGYNSGLNKYETLGTPDFYSGEKVANASTTNLTLLNQYLPINTNGVDDKGAKAFSTTGSGRVTLDGQAGDFQVSATVEIKTESADTGNKYYELRMSKNGTVFGPYINLDAMDGDSHRTLTFNNFVSMTTGDYLDIRIKQVNKGNTDQTYKPIAKMLSWNVRGI